MASKERIQRQKQETREKILTAALRIVKEEGWQALSLRKIADAIEYTAPIIYEYFTNKEAILMELTRQGFALLCEKLCQALDRHEEPAAQMEAMWMAYWDFAFAEKEYYQVMYGVETNCCSVKKEYPEVRLPGELFEAVTRRLMKDRNPTSDEVCRWYYTYWSVVHGLVSINIVQKGATDQMNNDILKTTITGITRALSE